jgi:hypothetical protein
MKHCPTCRRLYTDSTLNFCLEDGAALETVSNSSLEETLTLDANEPPPTEVLPAGIAPTINARHAPPTVRQQARSTRDEFQNVAPPAKAKRNTTSVVALTVVATILLLALGGLGAWLLLRDKTSGGGNLNISNRGKDESRNLNVNAQEKPGETPAINGNTNDQPGVVLETPTPLPTATPQSTPQIVDASKVRSEVSSALNGWRQTMVNPDVDAHMSYYADVLHTYYKAQDVNVSRVRSNVARAFSSYSTFDVQVTNLQIEVDPSGMRAVATFDKTFEFSNAEKRYAGSGLNRFWFEKIGGRWLITGEKDLKTYY